MILNYDNNEKLKPKIGAYNRNELMSLMYLEIYNPIFVKKKLGVQIIINVRF